MLRLFALTFLSALLSSCGKPAILRPDAPDTLYTCGFYAGQHRCYYQIDPPETVDAKATLMILHPAFTTPARIERLVALAPQATQRGYRVIYPEGIDGHWNDGRGAGRTETVQTDTDDVGFLSHVAAETRLPGKPLFLLGMSNGGMMAMRLVCQSAERFDGMATVVSNLPAGLAENCLQQNPLPVWLWFGAEDDVIPAKGGAIYNNAEAWGVVASAEETVDFWAWYNQASPAGTLDSLPTFDALPLSIERQDYQGKAPLTVYTALDAGHTWPGEPRFFAFLTLRGGVNQDVDGAVTILDWFDGLVAP